MFVCINLNSKVPILSNEGSKSKKYSSEVPIVVLKYSTVVNVALIVGEAIKLHHISSTD